MALHLINTKAALERTAHTLLDERTVSVDTEADSFHSYWHRICLLQISAGEHDYVIDPLAVDARPLAPVFADARIEKIMHAAENDVPVLKRDFGFEVRTLFDTMVAARILSYPRWGLADLLHAAFDVTLDKRFQRFDWAQRPLPQAAIEYAAADTRYLPRLRQKLADELHPAGHEEEALEEFARIADIPAVEQRIDPDDFWRVKGATNVPPASRAALRELYRFRDAQARRTNQAPFRIMPDALLTTLATEAPATEAQLATVPGMTPRIQQRYGRELLAALQRGRGQPPIFAERTRPADEVLVRYDALRAWRNGRAHHRGVQGDVIVANSVLKALASAPPHGREALEASGLLRPWKLRTYGDEILRVLETLP